MFVHNTLWIIQKCINIYPRLMHAVLVISWHLMDLLILTNWTLLLWITIHSIVQLLSIVLDRGCPVLFLGIFLRSSAPTLMKHNWSRILIQIFRSKDGCVGSGLELGSAGGPPGAGLDTPGLEKIAIYIYQDSMLNVYFCH